MLPDEEDDLDFDTDVPVWTDDEFPDWDAKTSRVVSGPLGTKAKFPGKRFTHWRKAKKHCEETYSVIKFGVWGFRWFARVRRADAQA